MIVSGQLQPGQHLVENDLAVALGVSRQPIREALLRLEAEEWVDLRPGQGRSFMCRHVRKSCTFSAFAHCSKSNPPG